MMRLAGATLLRRARTPITLLQGWLERRDWDEGTLLLIVGSLLGIACGGVVVVFYRLIDLSHLVFVEWAGRHVAWRVLYWPVLTALGMLAAWLVVRRARIPDGQNIPDVQRAVAKHDAVVPARPVAARTLASAITLGSGGSAGSEGPVAVLGAAMGSELGRRLRIRPRHRKVLVGCGAAAGISAAFNAPFAGAFFALEEILGSFSVGAFSPVVIASVVGSITARALLGAHPVFSLPTVPETHPVANALLYPLLGVACGIVSALYARLYLSAPRVVARVPGPEWLRPVLGGLTVGAIVAASGGLLAGDGHLAIPGQLFGALAWWVLLLLALAKIFATTITLSAGGSGGVFTPTLFIGAAVGGGVGSLVSQLVPGHVVHPHAWALVGMAGVIAGATRAPLTAIFMVFEMTNDPAYVGPLIIVAVVSLVTARRLAPHGLYDGWLAQRGEHLAHGVDVAVMDRLHVGMAAERDVPAVRAGAPLSDILAAAARTHHTVLPVVDDAGQLIGLADHRGIRDALAARGAMEALLVAEDLAEPVPPLRADQTLREALAAMNARGLDALPLVERRGECDVFVGLLTRAALLKAYERALAYAI